MMIRNVLGVEIEILNHRNQGIACFFLIGDKRIVKFSQNNDEVFPNSAILDKKNMDELIKKLTEMRERME